MKKIFSYLIIFVFAILYLCSCESEHAEHLHNYGVWHEEVNATCESSGTVGYYQCDYCGLRFDRNYNQIDDLVIPKIEHRYEKEKIKPTCENDGYTLYTCSRCGDSYKEDYVDPIGHEYGEVEYVWSEDFSKVTAIRVCYHDENHIEEETVLVTYSVITQPTCTLTGIGRYTSSKFRNKAFEIQTKEVTIVELGHMYGEVRYEWNSDRTSVTATRVCANDSSHIETETAIATYKVETEATCTGTGLGRYTSAAFRNSAFEVQTHDVLIEALGHSVVFDEAVAPTLGVPGLTEGSHCVVCGEVFVEQKEIPMLVSLTLSVNNESFGSVSENKVLKIGEEVTITATANKGCYFFGWFDGETLISDKEIFTFIMVDSNYELEAKFTKNQNSFCDTWDGSVATSFAGGTGTFSDPYIINTASQLAYMAVIETSSCYYKLMNDIDLNNLNWTPINFRGTFDGNGHVVTNLKISKTLQGQKSLGLFGSISYSHISNLGVENIDIDIEIDMYSTIYFGGLVGIMYDNSSLINCYTTGKIKVDFITNESFSIYVGGLVGYSDDVRNCYSNCDIEVLRYVDKSGCAYAGGLCGYSNSNNVDYARNSFATGSVFCANTYSPSHTVYTGGLFGNSGINYYNCYRYINQMVYNSYSSTDITYNNNLGTECDLTQLNDGNFYVKKLSWSKNTWDFSGLDFENGKFPKHIQSKEYKEVNLSNDGNGTTNFEDIIIKKNHLLNIIATPNIGYEFEGWYFGDELISEDSNYSFIVTESVEYTAKFKLKDYTLTVDTNKENIEIEINKTQFNYGDKIILTAENVEGYFFEGWYIDDELVSSELEFTLLIPNNDVIVVAVYREYFDLAVNVNTTEFGNVSGSKIAYETEMVKVVATANEGYNFFGWFEGDTLLSTELEYTFNMPSTNYKLEARFTSGEYIDVDIWDGSIATSFAGGDGTEENPYLISTGAQLAYFSNLINSSSYSSYDHKHYKLINNIDLNNVSWIPIGHKFDLSNYYFRGCFDGDGHTIYNLSIVDTKYHYIGLFGYLDGKVENLGIENISINISTSSGNDTCIGGLAGYCSSSNIENCYTTGIVKYSNSYNASNYKLYIGGITGYLSSSSIINSYSTCDVEGVRNYDSNNLVYSGGLVGCNNGDIDNSFASGNVSATNTYSSSYSVNAGGLVGKNGGTIANSYRYEGQVVTSSYYSGIINVGTPCSIDMLNSIGFYLELLNWNENIWVVEEFDFVNAVTPSFKSHKDYYQTFIKVVGTGSVNYNEFILAKNDKIQLLATCNTGCYFVGWFDGDELISKDLTLIYKSTSSKTLTAKFENIDYVVNAVTNKDEISVRGSKDDYHYEDTVILEACTVQGYYFEGWYLHGEKVSTSLSYTFKMPTNDLEVVAVYREYFDLVVDSNSADFGNVFGSKIAYETEVVTLVATPNEGYKFFGWVKDNCLLSKDSTFNFNMLSEDCTIEAWFVADDFAIAETNIWDGRVATSFAGGNGTKDNPYLISTGAELAYFSKLINSSSYSNYYLKYYKLINNIDLNNVSWTPIGHIYNSNGHYFSGYFDGDGHTIYNLSIVNTNYHYIGLFGYLGGKVENLGIENSSMNISVSSSNHKYIGGLAGYCSNSTIENCYTTGIVKYLNSYYSSSKYKLFIGGITGYLISSSLINNYSTCEIEGEQHSSLNDLVYSGGLVGFVDSYSTIDNSFATGNVSAKNATSSSYKVYAGGLVGINSGTITNSYRYEGQVVTTSYSSGIVGVGTPCSLDMLNSKDFYLKTLGWTGDWNLNSLDFNEQKYPTMQKFYQLIANVIGNGNTNINQVISQNKNNIVQLVATPEDGYRLIGWFDGEELLSQDLEYNCIISDVKTITAVFDYIEYIVDLEIGNGITVEGASDSYHYGDNVELIANIDEGYTFLGWYENNELISNELSYSFTVGLENRNIEVRSLGNEFTIEYAEKVGARIIFNSMGGSEVEPVTNTIFEYPVPTHEGYLFTGWYSDIALTKRYEFKGEITEDVVLYAGWTRYNATGVLSVDESLLSINAPDRNSSRRYYAFVPLVSQNITIYSESSYDTYGFLYDSNKNELTSDDDGGVNNNFSITYYVEAGKLYYIAPAGYSSDVSLSLFITGQKLPNVSVESLYLDQQKVNFGDNYKLLFKERKGYDFVGYFTGENGTGIKLTDSNGDSLVPYNTLGNMVVYHYYVPSTYNITLDYNDGVTDNGIIEVTYLSEFELPIPTREMFTFGGWYYEDNLINSDTWIIFDGDITLTAKWNPILVESIEFSNGAALDVANGVLELDLNINPINAYYSYVQYEIIHGTEETQSNLVEENGVVKLYALVSGEIMILVSLYNEYDELVYSENVIFYIYTTDVASVEIVNTNNIINVGEEVKVELEYYPSTAVPKGEVIYQLMQPNTCGATISSDGIITVTQPGSVRVRVKVDDSEWSSAYTFYVPNTISSPEEFYNIRNNLSGYYIITSDIDLSGYDSWQPIGYAENSDSGLSYINAFKGYIDGNGYKITGLRINVSETDYLTVGLFGALDNTARIKDLIIDNYEIVGEAFDSVVYVGGFAGIVNGKVSGCNVSGSIDILGAEYVGGAVGQLFGEFKDATIKTDLLLGGKTDVLLKVGGTIGYFPQGVLEGLNVSTTINIHASYGYYVGSIVGHSEGNINNSTVETANVIAYATVEDSYAGLLVGKTTYQEINNVNINGTLEVASAGTLYVGGIAGYAVDIKNTEYNGEITIVNAENIYYGNIVGYAEGNILNANSERNEVEFEATGKVYYGGIAGFVGGDVVNSSFIDNGLKVKANKVLYVGGIAGHIGGNVEDVIYESKDISLSSNSTVYYGGAVGEVLGAVLGVDIEFTDLQIETANTVYLGGAVGYAQQAFSNAEIKYSNLNISNTLTAYVGGAVGFINDKAQGISHNGGSVEINVRSTLYFGGIVGHGKDVNNIVSTIADLYIKGPSVYAGSIAGCAEDMITIETTLNKAYINANTIYYGGLAAQIAGNISNANVKSNVNIVGTMQLYAGSVVGKSTGNITNVSASGDITANSNTALIGGIAGENDGCIDDAEYIGKLSINVNKDIHVGGIVGLGKDIINSNSYSVIDVHQKEGSAIYTGGVVGQTQGSVEKTYYFGFIDVVSEGYLNEEEIYNVYVGGIVGQTSSNILGSKSNAVINVDNKYNKMLYVGGVAGSSSSSVENSKADGTITISNEYDAYIGGLIGYSTTVSKSFSIGSIKTTILGEHNLYLGGIAGYNSGKIDESYYSFGDLYGASEGKLYSGGISGYANADIINCYSSYSYIVTDMSKIGTSAYLGGIVGYNNATVSNSYSMNYIDGKADGASRTLYIGGIAGYNKNTVTECYTMSASEEAIRTDLAVSDIDTTSINSANVYAGGLVGYNAANAIITNAYTGNKLLTRNSVTGGLVGINEGSIINSISRSLIEVVFGEKVGAFAGNTLENGTYTDCYYSSSNLASNATAVGTGNASGITSKTNAELRGTMIYVNYDKSIWLIVNGKYPELVFDQNIWSDSYYGYHLLSNVINPDNQHQYPIPEAYCLITFDVGLGEYPIDPIYVHEGEGIFLVAEAQRIGYIFKGWYFDEEFTQPASGKALTFTADCTLYAKWEAIVYDLEVEVDGEGSVNIEEKSYIYLDEITLITDDVALDYVFVGWYEGDVLLSTDKTYTFKALPRSQKITAKYLSYYELLVTSSSSEFGSITTTHSDNLGLETKTYKVTAYPKEGYKFFGWFDGDKLLSKELEYTFDMPSANYKLEARFTSGEYKDVDVWDGSVATRFNGGAGTEENPYLISTGAELAYFSKLINSSSYLNYNTKYYKLINNIDLNNLSWTPIGHRYNSTDYYFSGYFDGNGHTIYNISIDNTNYHYIGLFGFLKGKVENLGLENISINISKSSSNDKYVGGLAGYCTSSTIENCYTKGIVEYSNSSNGYYVLNIGGITGCLSYSSIINSYSTCDVEGIRDYSSDNLVFSGGLVGRNENSMISNSFATGSVSAKNMWSSSYRVNAGGLVGKNSGTITNSYRYEGQVVTSSYSSGIVDIGTPCSLDMLNSSEFYLEVLKWNENIWAVEDFDFAHAVNPSYKSHKNYCQTFIEVVEGGSVNYNEFILAKNDKIELLATCNTGYYFVGWFDGDELISKDSTIIYKPTSSKTLTAKFENIDYVVHAVTNKDEISVRGSKDDYHYEDYVSLVARTVQGYYFEGWYLNGEKVSTSLSYTFKMPANDLEVVAVYREYFDLVVDSNSSDFGNVSESKTAYETEMVTLVATPNEGYNFFGWFEGDTLLSTELEYTFKMPSKDYKLEARFTAKENKTVDIWDGSVSTSFSGGDGSEENPYLISTGAELAYFSKLINNNSYSSYYKKHYKLINNIDLNNRSWTPIGHTYNSASYYFSGYFDGDGHIIYNLSIANTNYHYIGLFGYLNGNVENLGIENISINISASSSEDKYIGGLAGHCSNSTIENCYTSGIIKYSNSYNSNYQLYIGGITGYLYLSSLINSYSTCDVEGIRYSSLSQFVYSGGLVGYINSNSKINNSFASGTVSAKNTYSKSQNANAGGLTGYNSGIITNSYSYEGQVITSSYSSGIVTCGDICSIDMLNSKDFYTKTLGWDEMDWCFDYLDYDDGQTPHLRNSKTYYQVFVESDENGTVNLTEVIVNRGSDINFIATPNEGYEFVGWFDGDEFISEEMDFIYTPIKSINIRAVFDVIENTTFLVYEEEGLTISDHELRYLENTVVDLSLEVEEGYLFIGWFDEEENQISTDLNLKYNIGTSTVKIYAKSEAIDYTLSVDETYDDAGEITTSLEEHNVFNVHNEIEVSYTINPGYTFLGWYEGENLLSEELTYIFEAPARNLNIEAKTDTIKYQLSASATEGGKTNSSGGSYSILDEITLIATPDKTYDFIGWYLNDEVYSYDKEIVYKMPLADSNLEAKFEIGYVEINVISGFNGHASGTTKQLKDTEITVTATPNEGYMLEGWYLNGEVVSRSSTFTQVYDVSGSYTLYAEFIEEGIVITYHPNNGDEMWSEQIFSTYDYVTPYLYREKYDFEGWYIDKNFTNKLDISNLDGINDVYAKWTEKVEYSQLFKDLENPYTIELYSRKDIVVEIEDVMYIYDSEGNILETTIVYGSKKGYYILSADFEEGRNYQVKIIDDEVFATNGMRDFSLSFKREECDSVTYSSEVLQFASDYVIELFDGNVGLVLDDETELLYNGDIVILKDYDLFNGDLLYCYDGENLAGYVSHYNITAEGDYEIFFSNEEVTFDSIFESLSVADGDIEFDLENATVEGDQDEAMAAFTEVATEATSFNMLYSRLTTLAENDSRFSFSKPQFTPKFECKGTTISISVTITVDGQRLDYLGNIQDEFKIKVVVSLTNVISTSCDIDINGLSVDKFEYSIKNVTTAAFSLDVLYSNKEQENDDNYDALKLLLDEYKTTLAEKKELPFDVDSRNENTFDDLKVVINIPIGTSGLTVDVVVTPFVRYVIIGQLDIDTSISVNNTCTLAYVNGKFNVYFNSSTEKSVTVYALAYVNIEAGVNVSFDIYFTGLKGLINAGVDFEVGPYLTASGALIYENGEADFNGYVQWGYFYDYGAHVSILKKTFETESNKVSKPINDWGTHFMYLGFDEEEVEYEIQEYTMDIFEEIDHQVYGFNLDTLTSDFNIADRSNYEYVLEENDYIYINDYNQIRIKQWTELPIHVKLTISIGDVAVKVVKLTVNIKQFNVTCLENENGSIKTDKPYAMVGEPVTIKFFSNEPGFVVEYWMINNRKIEALTPTTTISMETGGLTIGVIGRYLKDAIFIYTIDDFLSIKNDLSATYIQMNDLNFNYMTINPFGTSSNPFTGKYYGNGYEIKNLNVSYLREGNTINRGLFAHTNGAVFHGVILDDVKSVDTCYLNGTSNHYTSISGILVAHSKDTTFLGCKIRNTKFERSSQAGSGLLVMNNTSFTTYVGTLVGLATGTTKVNTFSAENVTVYGEVKAGKAFFSSSKPIEENHVGGIIGAASGYLSMQDIYFYGSVKGKNSGVGTSSLYLACVLGANAGNLDANIRNVLVNGGILILTEKSYSIGAVTGATSRVYGSGWYVTSESYSLTESYSDRKTNSFTSSEIFQEGFVFESLGFDSSLWTLNNGSLILNPIKTY